MSSSVDKLFDFLAIPFLMAWDGLRWLFDKAITLVTWITNSRKASFAALGVILIVPATFLIGRLIGSGDSSAEVAWREYFQATNEVQQQRQNAEWFTDLVNDGPQGDFNGDHLRGTGATRLWAQLFAGDQQLASALRTIYSDKDQSRIRLQTALDHFDRVLDSASAGDGLLRQRALLGKAAAAESMMACESDPEQQTLHWAATQQALTALEEDEDHLAVSSYAKQRLKMLRQMLTDAEGGPLKEDNFHRWFASFKPIAPPPPGPPGSPIPAPQPDEGGLLPPPVLGPSGPPFNLDPGTSSDDSDTSEDPAPDGAQDE